MSTQADTARSDNGQTWIITGGRNFTSQETFDVVMQSNVEQHGWPSMVVHRGYQRGADLMAEEWAQNNGIESLAIHADQARHGHNAYKVRNDILIGLNPGRIIIFFNGIGNAELERMAVDSAIPVVNVVRTHAFGEVFTDAPTRPKPAATAAE